MSLEVIVSYKLNVVVKIGFLKFKIVQLGSKWELGYLIK